jgi:hypothetical protein
MEAGGREFSSRIQLDPNQSRTHYDYGYWFFAVLGHLDEALQQLLTAAKMDPLSAVIQRDLAEVLFSAGRYAEKSACGTSRSNCSEDDVEHAIGVGCRISKANKEGDLV